ncbi:MAG: hypothetical protein GWM98_29605, partial [Nitrospinaceae bacterium]|nr:hypothetical protein [Nitrospinaceae bacterium]NIR57857.1 hypothetical protein [Nitrospinaceae bacterium]NIS88316.1 hypothetical protein [Nitrospinaceae bacterium]NIT85194.1 hypothetical protein [Nitrospinaceae bacterium]NIU47344.1 hypothetical protein [Nitrospinaceae bacterium]
LGVGALYFGMGQMNEPVWTEFQSATGEFRLEFPDSDPPKTRGTLRGDCLEGKIFYVDSRHGPFKIHGVLSEAGRLNLNS